MPRRILLLITDLKIGGMPFILRDLAIRLARQTRATIEVACLSPWGPVADQLRDASVRVTALSAGGPADVRVFPRLVRLIRGGQFDTVFSFLVHANAAAAVASMACRDVRFLQCIQTTQPEPRWHWKAQALAHHAAEKIAVPSESVVQVLQDWSNVPADKLAVIPNAIDVADFTPSPVPMRNPQPSPYPVGFIGRLDPVKCIPDLLRAVELLGRTIELHVFGEGAERPHIEAEIARLRVGDRVTLHGAIAAPQDALSRVGLLVLPSLAEGFGRVLIEAMAAGVPVVATNVAGIRDVVRDGRTGVLVPAHAPEQLAAAIRRVVDDRELRAYLIASGAADVRARFGWDTVLAQYARLLDI